MDEAREWQNEMVKFEKPRFLIGKSHTKNFVCRVPAAEYSPYFLVYSHSGLKSPCRRIKLMLVSKDSAVE